MRTLMQKVLPMGLALTLPLLLAEGPLFTGQEQGRFQLFFTADISGYLKPCG